MKDKKYQTAGALLAALSDRLKQKSKKEGLDIQRLRRQVAFDRLLLRLFSKTPSPWVLRGLCNGITHEKSKSDKRH